MDKELIEKIVKEKFSFETDYGTKTSVEEIHIDDDTRFSEMITIEVKFQRLVFIDVEKISELSKSLLASKPQVFAGQDEHVWAMFWVNPSDLTTIKGDLDIQ